MTRILTRKLALILSFVLVLIVYAVYFPGRQFVLAFQMSTGIGTHSLQSKIDALEEKAIRKESFNSDDIIFLDDLYTTMYRGARLLPPVKQTANMMEWYLLGNGGDFKLNEKIFIGNNKVINKMREMKAQISADATTQERYDSGDFYMPDGSNTDSVFGLYWGRLIAYPTRHEGKLQINWRAEVPWEWPSYDSIYEKYGDYHAENFPLPNLASIFVHPHFSLFIDNGLGEYLVQLEIAQSFLAYAEWTEHIE